jgi:hypothetical protein
MIPSANTPGRSTARSRPATSYSPHARLAWPPVPWGFDKAALDADSFPDGRWKSFLVVDIGHPGNNLWFDRLPRLGHDNAPEWI